MASVDEARGWPPPDIIIVLNCHTAFAASTRPLSPRCSQDGNSLLHAAARGGDDPCVAFALGKGLSVSAANVVRAPTETARRGLQIAPLSARQSLCPHASTGPTRAQDGQTPLYHAVSACRLACVATLVEAGADVNARTKVRLPQCTVTRLHIVALLILASIFFRDYLLPPLYQFRPTRPG